MKKTPKLEIAFLKETSHKISESFVKNTFLATIKTLNVRGFVFVDIALIGEETMRKLNRFWRGKNRVTDVLSFSQLDNKNGEGEFVNPPDNVLRLGQIMLCPSYIKKQARKAAKDETEELKTALVHGSLHLLGYDHEKVSKKKAEEMFSLQEKILNEIR